MHVYFSGIGGTAIGPLALVAKQAGYEVSGSDKQDSQYIQYLQLHGMENIHIGQAYDQIAEVHARHPIDWYVYSSAVAIENPDAPELRYCLENNIKTSKRDELLNQIIQDKQLKLIAIAGTHGKTTTTAMAVWLFKQLGIALSYSVGAKISFGEMGRYTEGSEYFILETDEFDRNFLAFHPYMSLITGVGWDHHEIFPTPEEYQQAFRQFIGQSLWNTVWKSDMERLQLPATDNLLRLDDNDPRLQQITLLGHVNRRDAWQVVQAVQRLTEQPLDQLIAHMNRFPGLNRRFEPIADDLYSDYAHTEEKIRGALQTAREASENVVVVYEPLTDRRQHFIKDAYKDLFQGVKKLYWVPSYLAREDPDKPVLSPADLIEYMDNKDIAEPAELNTQLKQRIEHHITDGDLVVCLSGGGGGSLDEWLRANFNSH
jgi:UDP-N-acetylmuramate--alanine ligase